MKADNTIAMIGRIREKANEFIVKELVKRGHEGLAPTHGNILATLLFQGEMTKTDIAERIKRERSTVTTLISKLEKLGYIESRTNEEDGRSKIVSLTTKGESVRNDMIEISESLFEQQYIGMNDDEVRQFRHGLKKVYDNFMGDQ